MALYPGALVTTANIANAGANLSTNPHSDLHDDMRDEIVAIEAELGVAPSSSYSTVAARLNTGWQHIAVAQLSAAASFSVSIPSSTYDIIRVYIYGTIAAGAELFHARINGDTTAGLHRFVTGEIDATPSTAASTNTGTAWRIGQASATGNTNFVFTMWDVTTAGGFASGMSMQCVNTVYNATAGTAQVAVSGGNLASNLTLSSILFFPAASTFTGRYIAEGYKIP